MMKFVYDDGGRAEAGYKGSAGDCVCRAIAIASGRPYSEVYEALSEGTGAERTRHDHRALGKTARRGIHTGRKWFKEYMKSLGFEWMPTMGIGTGCKVHLREDELPSGRMVVAVSRHYTAVIDGVIYDTHNPSERATTYYSANYPESELPKNAVRTAPNCGWVYSPERCVYGYWIYRGAV